MGIAQKLHVKLPARHRLGHDPDPADLHGDDVGPTTIEANVAGWQR